MLGKPEWFTTRKFGWGLGIQKPEALLYIGGVIALAIMFTLLPLPAEIKLLGIAAIIIVILVDTIHIMIQVYSKLDEREQKHQMLAETNAAYVGVIGLTLYMAYLIADSIMVKNVPPDPFEILPIIFILLAMSFAKGGTLIFVEKMG